MEARVGHPELGRILDQEVRVALLRVRKVHQVQLHLLAAHQICRPGRVGDAPDVVGIVLEVLPGVRRPGLEPPLLLLVSYVVEPATLHRLLVCLLVHGVLELEVAGRVVVARVVVTRVVSRVEVVRMTITPLVARVTRIHSIRRVIHYTRDLVGRLSIVAREAVRAVDVTGVVVVVRLLVARLVVVRLLVAWWIVARRIVARLLVARWIVARWIVARLLVTRLLVARLIVARLLVAKVPLYGSRVVVEEGCVIRAAWFREVEVLDGAGAGGGVRLRVVDTPSLQVLRGRRRVAVLPSLDLPREILISTA